MSVVSEGKYTTTKRTHKKLIQAVLKGKVKTVQDLLLRDDVDVNAVDVDLRTLLMHAVVLENIETRTVIVKSLLKSGVKLNAKDADGKTALMYAASDPENVDTVKLLLDTTSCDPNAQDLEGNTALIHAVNSNNIRCIRALTSGTNLNPLDINLANKYGYTALLMATKLHRVECCKILVWEAGANPANLSQHWQRALSRLLNDATLQPPGAQNKPRHFSASSSASKAGASSLGQRSLGFSHQDMNRPGFPAQKPPLSQIPTRSADLLNPVTPYDLIVSNTKRSRSVRSDVSADHFPPRSLTSREDSMSSLNSDVTLTDFNDRPLTMREASNSSISTLESPTSRPNTRQDSNLSSNSLDWTNASRPFTKERSHLFRRNSLSLLADMRVTQHNSPRRPGTSLIDQSTGPWLPAGSSRDMWFDHVPQTNGTSRTLSFLSSYPQARDKLLRNNGKSAKETALKQIRGSLKFPSTPTPLTSRLFHKGDKSDRRLPAIKPAKL